MAAAVIYLQVDFLKTKDLGFDKERLLSIPLGIANAENAGIYRKLKATLDGNPRVMGGAAQLLQKRKSSLFSAWHFGHSTVASPVPMPK